MVLNGAKWIVSRCIELNRVNNKKVTGAVVFMKPHVVLIFFVTDNRLIFCIINPTGKSDKYHNKKKYKLILNRRNT